jgi:hypothetical protein
MIPATPVDPVILQIERWQDLLMCLFFGFLWGLMSNIKTGGGNRYFTVAIAQIPYEFQEFKVPLLPRCTFVALLPTLLFVLNNTRFLSEHPLFSISTITLSISIGIWLYAASRELQSREKDRKAAIEKFLADPNAGIPIPTRRPGELGLPLHIWTARCRETRTNWQQSAMKK